MADHTSFEIPDNLFAFMLEFESTDDYKKNVEAYKQNRRAVFRRQNELARPWRSGNLKKLREIQRRYTAKHPGYRSEWNRRNPAKAKALTHRRLARKKTLPAFFTDQDWQRALDYFGGCCAVCGRPPGLWHTLSADHWIPLTSADCPGTVPTNIMPLCYGVSGCNNSKNDHDPHEWLLAKFGPRKAKQIEKRINAYFNSVRSGYKAVTGSRDE